MSVEVKLQNAMDSKHRCAKALFENGKRGPEHSSLAGCICEDVKDRNMDIVMEGIRNLSVGRGQPASPDARTCSAAASADKDEVDEAVLDTLYSSFCSKSAYACTCDKPTLESLACVDVEECGYTQPLQCVFPRDVSLIAASVCRGSGGR